MAQQIKLQVIKCQGIDCTNYIQPNTKAGIIGIERGEITCEECKAWRKKIATKFTLPLLQETTIRCQRENCPNEIIIQSGGGALMANQGKAICQKCQNKDFGSFPYIEIDFSKKTPCPKICSDPVHINANETFLLDNGLLICQRCSRTGCAKVYPN